MTKIPRPGAPVRGSRSGAPVMALLDLLGRRWAMGVLWTLCEGGPATFRVLQELREARLVERTTEGYAATKLGSDLFEHLEPLGAWAKVWGKALK